MIVGWEMIIVAVIIVAVLLWGPKKLPELARSVGQAKTEFDKAKREAEVFTKSTETSTSEDTLLKTAKDLGISTEGKTKDQISQEIVQKAKTTKETQESQESKEPEEAK